MKTSSIGDLIHNMPAVADIHQQYPDAHVSWVVEEDYASLVARHPFVGSVIPIKYRVWRNALLKRSTWREIRQAYRELRSRHYDIVIDTQGRFHSGLIAWLARGERHGYSFRSKRSRLAFAFFYSVRHRVTRDAHAVVRNRLLTGLALKYQPPEVIDYGLRNASAPDSSEKRAILAHSTVKEKKLWPEENWIQLRKQLGAMGYKIILPWGTAEERARSVRIAADSDAEIPDRKPLEQLIELFAGAALVVGMDTGLLHLAAATKAPLVGIYVGTNPKRTGPAGAGPIETTGSKGAPPTVEEVLAAVARVVSR